MGAKLYINPKGRGVTYHSYSAGADWEYCKRLYKLKRPEGWRERRSGAWAPFGKAIEVAVRAHCLRDESAPAVFANEWTKANPEFLCIACRDKHATEETLCAACKEQRKANRELEYSEKEKDWATLSTMGDGLMRLFEATRPSLPGLAANAKTKPRFSVKLEREMFPGTPLAGIKFTAEIDCLAAPAADHPLLPRIANALPVAGATRPLVIDIKTSARAYTEDTGMVALDPQLHSYAWQTGVPDVAFLVFVKSGLELKRGTRVQAFDAVKFPGIEILPSAAPDSFYLELCEPEGEDAWWVLPHGVTDALHEYTKGLKGKALTEKRMEFLRNAGALLSAGAFTTQRIQFLAARVSDEDMRGSGERIGQQVAEIVAAQERDFYPKEGGIRWPNDKCLNCAMRGICSGNDALRDELLVKQGEEWLEDAA